MKIGKPENQKARKSESQRARESESQAFQSSGYLAFWLSGFLGFRFSSYAQVGRTTLVFCILCLFSLYFPFSSEGTFKDIYLGARPLAMGGAYTALADDVDCVLINPAGLSNIKDQQLIAVLGTLYMGLEDNSFISQNLLGYSYKQNRVGSAGIVWKRFGVMNLYSENIVAVGLARDFGLYLKKSEEKRKKNFSFGAALNLLNWDSAPTVGADGKVIEDLSGWTGFSFDMGFLIRPSENISVAFSLQNLNSPNIASNSSKIEEKLPIIARMGVSAIGEKMTWVMDLSLAEGEVDLRTGIERQEYDGEILLRAGFSLENLAWGTNLTLGAGYKPSDSFRIDYAFVYPINTILDTLGSHRISVVYDF